MAELVDQSLAPLRLLHDSLLVVLSQGPRQLVVVHGGTVLITNILLKGISFFEALNLTFLFPHSVATLTESTILKIPLGLSIQ